MPILTPAEALRKRDELIELGYAIIPCVLQNPLLDELHTWSHDVFERLPVDPKYRYQGSDIHVSTERLWNTQPDQQANERHFADPIVEKIIDYPAQREACRLLQLEGLEARDVIILLSKPAYGPPLYWHQDYTNWNSPEAASPWPTVIFLSYYLSDTTRENGCLRAIPGSHRKRIAMPRYPAQCPQPRNSGHRRSGQSGLHGPPRCHRRAPQSRRPDHRRCAPAARGLAQPDGAAPHSGAGLARRLSLSRAAQLVEWSHSRCGPQRRSECDLRSDANAESVPALK